MNRAELVKTVVEAFNLSWLVPVNYSDTQKWQWYSLYLSKAVVSWIIDWPFKQSKFRPADSVNRAEAMKIILKASWIKLEKTNELVFSDVPKNVWFARYVNFAYKKWIVSWYWNWNFWPWNSVTRWQVAKMISKVLEIKNNWWVVYNK